MKSDFLKTVPQYILPKQGLTRFAGLMATIKSPAIKHYLITNFIKTYNVNMQEALEENPEQYACFNDFFIRHLKPECRPISTSDIVSPVDGVISEIGEINKGTIIQAKGRDYTTKALLAAENEQSTPFDQGLFTTLYLSPKDYHRVHMPLDATLTKMIYVPGKLFSVQPATARVIPQLFSRNERLVVYFDTEVGPMVMVLVGATIVGAIGTSWQGEIKRSRKPMFQSYDDTPVILPKAAEMGYFKLGSTVILLFADRARVQWKTGLKAGDSILFGEAMGQFTR